MSSATSKDADGDDAPALLIAKGDVDKLKFEGLPTNVMREEQLAGLPTEYLCQGGGGSGGDDDRRPLRWTDEFGVSYRHALRPMSYSVGFILVVELLERFSYFGVSYTQTSFLTGVYDRDWNPYMTSVEASTYVSMSTAVTYTAPFIGAILADWILGDYWVILLGTVLLYIPGILVLAMTSIPELLGDQFNLNALDAGLLFLYPIGAGAIKSVVNIFGARQFHPQLQSSMIESYYVNFYMCINVGALAGGFIIPVVAQRNVTVAYFIPVAMLALGVALFTFGTPRYVRTRPRFGDLASFVRAIKTAVSSPLAGCTGVETRSPPSFDTKEGDWGTHQDGSIVRRLSHIMRISALVVPFNIVYSQQATTFIVQGTVMKSAFGFIDAATMNNADALSVLLFGHVVGSHIYPALTRRGVRIPTSYKFALGSFFAFLSIAWALVVDYRIHSVYAKTIGGGQISILWQAPSYILIGAGEIFGISAAYEVAFTVAPRGQKAVSSAINLFFTGGVPSFICIALYRSCKHWFQNADGDANIQAVGYYSEAHVYKYFWVLLGIAALGTLMNVLPSINEWVASIEDQATGCGRMRTGAAKQVFSRQSTQLTRAMSSMSDTPTHERDNSYPDGEVCELLSETNERSGGFHTYGSNDGCNQ